MTIVVRYAGGRTREQFDSFFHGADDVHVKLLPLNRFDDVQAEHQCVLIESGNEHALIASQSLGGAQIVKCLDFLIESTDGQYATLLIDASRHRHVLA